MRGKMGEGEMEDEKGIVMDFEDMVCVRNLGGTDIDIHEGWYFILCGGGSGGGRGIFPQMFLSVMEVVCSGVGFWLVEGGIFKLGGSFVVVVEVENEEFESVVECVMGPVFLVVLLVAFESDVGGT